MSRGLRELWTIGYEGRALVDFLEVLQRARIQLVIDVRALPLSRRKGFSKRALGAALEAVGIEYRHVRAAGNPYRALKAQPQRSLALYAAHLDRAPKALGEVAELALSKRTALVCFEADASECHRSVIAERLRGARPGLVIKNL